MCSWQPCSASQGGSTNAAPAAKRTRLAAGLNAALQAGRGGQGTVAASVASLAGRQFGRSAQPALPRALQRWSSSRRRRTNASRPSTWIRRTRMYHLWLGRTLGEVADRANFLSAYSLAKRARSEFEQAVQLDPRNAEALADLGEFYSSAPGVVGGGTGQGGGGGRAARTVLTLRGPMNCAPALPARTKTWPTAERELKAASQPAPIPRSSGCGWPAFIANAKR